MRARELEAFTETTYDILVVGGGIYGLAIALEAARRRLRVALVDAGDFGAATSFNHQKTAHGGLRSLQSGRLDRARDSIRARRAARKLCGSHCTAPGERRHLRHAHPRSSDR